jgi:glycosyltransferase involved in cell wall biosynthesis
MLVLPYFFPRVGGVENYALNIARELRSREWDVVIVTTGKEPGVGKVEGMTVYRLATSFTVSNTPIGLKWRRQLRRIIGRERPDIINGHTPVPFLADMAERVSGTVPYVLTYHNDLEKDSLAYKALLRLVSVILVGPTLRRSAEIIATSDYYLRKSRHLKGFAAKAGIVHPGVDLSLFHPDIEVPQDLAARYAGRRVILFVGSLNKSQQHKGLGILIAAVALLRQSHPDPTLVVVGSGDGTDMYRSMASAAGVAEQTVFTGYVDDRELAQYYKLATVFAMPSTDRSEGFGMVYTEASAVGLPVVGSDVGGVPYAIKDGETGLLVEPRSADALCRALRTLLDDEKLARRLGENGAVRARKEFGWSLAGERTDAIFREACSGSPSSFAC